MLLIALTVTFGEDNLLAEFHKRYENGTYERERVK